MKLKEKVTNAIIASFFAAVFFTILAIVGVGYTFFSLYELTLYVKNQIKSFFQGE